MSEERIASLETQVARLEERMKTMQAEYKTDIALLAKQLADRDTANTRWVIAAIGIAAGLLFAALKLL